MNFDRVNRMLPRVILIPFASCESHIVKPEGDGSTLEPWNHIFTDVSNEATATKNRKSDVGPQRGAVIDDVPPVRRDVREHQ